MIIFHLAGVRHKEYQENPGIGLLGLIFQQFLPSSRELGDQPVFY